MSDSHSPARSQVADRVGLWIQELHTSGRLRGTQPLLRIDGGEQSRRAPFRLDAATGRIHRENCGRVPSGSLSALYSVRQFDEDDQLLACPRCKPMPNTDGEKKDADFPTDVLFGLLSIVNQFGSVLRERGQEYRNSSAGKLLGAQIETLYRGVNAREKAILDVVMTSLDELVNTIHDLHADLDKANGGANGGRSANGVEPPRTNGRAPHTNGHGNGHDPDNSASATRSGGRQRRSTRRRTND
jgi:hypothetical protein